MNDWLYVALAYGVVWTVLVLYGMTLQRRIAQAQTLANRMQQEVNEAVVSESQERLVCDTQVAH